MRKVLNDMMSGADRGTGPILVAAVTRSLADAVAAFVAATCHNGAFAPAALADLVGREPDKLTAMSLYSAVTVANATAEWWAGDSWPNGPAHIAAGPSDEVLGEHLAFILNAIAEAGGPPRGTFMDYVHWRAFVFGSGRSRVALVAPALPHPNDRRQPTFDQYAVVAYLVDDDGSPRRETWGYRMAPIETLAAKAG